MDLQSLSSYIKELLIDNDRVSLFGIGSFVAEYSPAFFSGDGNTLFPPVRKISFRQDESWDDRMIAYLYACRSGRAMEEVSRELVNLSDGLRLELRIRKSVLLPGFGQLCSTKEGQVYFVADPALNLDPESVGLHPLPLKVLSRDRAAVRDRMRQMEDLEKSGADESEKMPAELPAGEPDILQRSDRKKRNRRLAVSLAVFLGVALLVWLAFRYRLELGHFFEGLLYSEEERTFLERSGHL